MLLRVVSSRVVLLGAPFSVVLASVVREHVAHSGLELPSREDDNFAPGTRRGATAGSPSRRLVSFAQLSGHRALPLTSAHVSVRAARLSCSTPLQPRFVVRARDTGI